MEQGACADYFALADEGNAAAADSLVEVLDSFEIGIDQRLVHEVPEMLGGLQPGAMGGLEHEPDAIWNSQIFWPVPSGVIELQDDPLVFTSARRFSEIQKNKFEQLL